MVFLIWVVNSTSNIIIIKVDHLRLVIERKWQGLSYLIGVLNRMSLGLGRDIEHHRVRLAIRLIVLIQSSEFPFFGRVPSGRICCLHWTELPISCIFYFFLHYVIYVAILLSYWFNKFDHLSQHRVQHLSPQEQNFMFFSFCKIELSYCHLHYKSLLLFVVLHYWWPS